MLTTLLWGCSNEVSNSMEKRFQSVVPIADVNKSLKLSVNSGEEDVDLDSKIPILIENTSSHFILLDYTGNYIQLFTIRNGDSVKVKSELTYEGSRVLSPQGTLLLNRNPTWAQPALDDKIFDNNQK